MSSDNNERQSEEPYFYDRKMKKKQIRRNHRHNDRQVLRDLSKGQIDIDDYEDLLDEEEY